MVTRMLAVALLVTAGCNLYAAAEGGATPAERLARLVLCIIGVTTAWPHVSEEKRRP